MIICLWNAHPLLPRVHWENTMSSRRKHCFSWVPPWETKNPKKTFNSSKTISKLEFTNPHTTRTCCVPNIFSHWQSHAQRGSVPGQAKTLHVLPVEVPPLSSFSCQEFLCHLLMPVASRNVSKERATHQCVILCLLFKSRIPPYIQGNMGLVIDIQMIILEVK